MVLVKICGLTSPEDAAAAVAAGADLLGFVFVPGTPRALDPTRAEWIRHLEGVETVGVFRDADLELMVATRRRLALDRIQLHGDEPDEVLDRLGPATLRRVRPEGRDLWRRVRELQDRCLPLLDPGAGDGRAWAWRELPTPPAGVRFGLAGGLGPDTVAAACSRLRPVLVDTASGVERAPRTKDPALLERFVREARRAAASDPGRRP